MLRVPSSLHKRGGGSRIQALGTVVPRHQCHSIVTRKNLSDGKVLVVVSDSGEGARMEGTEQQPLLGSGGSQRHLPTPLSSGPPAVLSVGGISRDRQRPRPEVL